MMIKLAMAMIIASVSACSLIPEQVASPQAIPTGWPAEVAVAIPAHTDLPPMTESSWRRYFTEPALQATIATALESSRDLAAAVSRLEQARAEAGAVESDRWPHVELVSQRNANHIPSTVRGNNAGSTQQRYDVYLGASYEADFWGRVSSLDAAARATFLASEFAHQSFRLTLIGDVAIAWFALQELQQRERLLTTTTSARETSLDLIRKRRDVGLSGDLDVLAADASYHSTRAELANTTRQRAAAENALRAMIGSELREGLKPPVLTSEVPPPLPTFPSVAIGLPSEAILRRPDIRAAEQRLLAANANIGAARAAFLPKITLTANAGMASSALTSLFEAGSRSWLFLPALHLPIFDAGRNEAALDLAKARANAAVADYERTVELAFRDIADILSIAVFGGQQVRELYAAADSQMARLKLVEARYNAGVANYLELLDAQRDALAAQQSQYAARRQTNSAAALFFKTVGGV